MATKSPRAQRKIVWRVRVVMAEREVRSVSELVRRLDAIGVPISVAQLGRLIDGKTQRWNQEVLEGMMAVLDCDLADLVQSESAA
jgi:DNA-binding Xre family transcriptional regulator